MRRTIHCIWLGGAKTPLAERCRESWMRFAPGWEIREWNEIPDDAPKYVRDAAAKGKWAFVSDWLRFKILLEEGGVYFDYDLELLKPMSNLPDGEWVAAEWNKHGEWGFNPGSGIALEKGSEIARRMLEWYEGAEFGMDKTVGNIMCELLGDPETTTKIKVLAPNVMSPVDWKGRRLVDDATVGFHHYVLSWISRRRRICRWLSWHHLDWVVQLGLRARRLVSYRVRVFGFMG